MRFEIEFYRWKAPRESEVVSRRSGQFANLDDAKTYGLQTANTLGSDGFRVLKNGATQSDIAINHQ